MGLKFDPKNHAYSFNGQKVLGVTSVLKTAGRINEKFMNAEACKRGTAVHAACHYRLLGDLDEETLHDEIKPYLAAFDNFMAESEFKPIIELCEKMQHHPDYGFAGTPDLVGWLHNLPAVIDIKSGGLGYARYQLAAYAEFPEIVDYFGDTPQRLALQLNKKGRLFLTEFDDPNDLAVFLDDLKQARLVA